MKTNQRTAINRRTAIRAALFSAGGVFAGPLLQPQAQASATGIMGGCALVILTVIAGVTVRMYMKRCTVKWRRACNPNVGHADCHGATEQWWKTHPEWKRVGPAFDNDIDCAHYWSTQPADPPDWCKPPSASAVKYLNIVTSKPVQIAEVFYDDSPEYGLLPEQVMKIRCSNGHPELVESWSDFGDWVFIENREETEPVLIGEFEAEGQSMLLQVRFG